MDDLDNQKYPTNVLILGKTGVGKSSLLNYLFGKTIADTKAGNPVTTIGIHKQPPFHYKDIDIVIYDSWGLEPDKGDEWRKIIEDTVYSNGLKEIKDWYHTIIYCIDAKRSRIDDFELEIIQKLADGGNRLVFALTRSDVASQEEIAAISKILNRFNFEQVKVCSCYRKLIGGKTIEPEGRDELILAICRNLTDNLFSKSLKKYLIEANKFLDDSINNVLEEFDKKSSKCLITNYGDEFRHEMEEIMQTYCKRSIEKARDNFFANIRLISKMEAILELQFDIKSILTSEEMVNAYNNSKLDLSREDEWDNSFLANLKEFLINLLIVPLIWRTENKRKALEDHYNMHINKIKIDQERNTKKLYECSFPKRNYTN